jgi:uncharacterized membrane protein (DUF2068 family)
MAGIGTTPMAGCERPRRRPLGVGILAALGFLTGGLELLAGAGVAGLAGWFRFAGAGLLAVGLLQLLFAWGSWMVRRWAWWAGLTVNLLWVLGAMVSLLGGLQWLGAAAAALLHVAIFAYLLTPRVRRAFDPARAAGGAGWGATRRGCSRRPVRQTPERGALRCPPDATDHPPR